MWLRGVCPKFTRRVVIADEPLTRAETGVLARAEGSTRVGWDRFSEKASPFVADFTEPRQLMRIQLQHTNQGGSIIYTVVVPTRGSFPSGMTSAEFVAAQQRVLARRQLRATEAQTRRESQRSLQATASASQLPFPFRGLARKGIESWGIIKGREGTRPAFRVGQVDAELLDEELLELLKAQVGEALKFFGVRFSVVDSQDIYH